MQIINKRVLKLLRTFKFKEKFNKNSKAFKESKSAKIKHYSIKINNLQFKSKLSSLNLSGYDNHFTVNCCKIA